MRKTIKSTKPETKRKYTRKSKLRTERTERTQLNEWERWFIDEVADAFDNVKTDVKNIFSRLEKLERKVPHTEAIAPMVTEMITKIGRELARSRNS